MSDTSNLANNNIEPSMEDILSSIRKVIAEDLSQQEASEAQATIEVEPQLEIATPEIVEVDIIVPTEVVDVPVTEQQTSAEDHLDDILELDNLLGDINDPGGALDETMELIQLEGETEEHVQDNELERITVPSPALPDFEPVIAEPVVVDTGFDETLDLVMDAETSDYVTENLAPFTAEPQEEHQTTEAPIADDVQIESILDDILQDLPNNADETAELTETAQELELVRAPLQASANDDMDLVKSLLEDLMDEPISETVSTSVETAMAEVSFDIEDNFSEDDLLIPDPEAIKAEAETVEVPSQPPTGTEPLDTEMDTLVDVQMGTLFDNSDSPEIDRPELDNPEFGNNIENELAQLAREIAEVRDAHTENLIPTDDVIELSTPDYASKLAISASLVAGAAATEEEPQGLIAAAAESDLESLQQLIAETDLNEPAPEIPEETPEEIEILISPIQEEEAMAAPLKTDVLSDADTQQEVGNAFASLTTTVQEHALAEENGPPIGELVKEALRPMLQEWLDKNLKAMVQRAVTKEIKRISTGK